MEKAKVASDGSAAKEAKAENSLQCNIGKLRIFGKAFSLFVSFVSFCKILLVAAGRATSLRLCVGFSGRIADWSGGGGTLAGFPLFRFPNFCFLLGAAPRRQIHQVPIKVSKGE